MTPQSACFSLVQNEREERVEELREVTEARDGLQGAAEERDDLQQQVDAARAEAKTLMGLLKNGGTWGFNTITSVPKTLWEAISA